MFPAKQVLCMTCMPVRPFHSIHPQKQSTEVVERGQQHFYPTLILRIQFLSILTTWSAVKSMYPGRMRKSLEGRGIGSKGQAYGSLRRHPHKSSLKAFRQRGK